MSGEQKTGKTLHRLKIEGDYLDACRNRVWIDGLPVETVTDIEIDLRMNASGVNAATISAILPDGIDVDVATDIRVDDETAATLVALGWRPPLSEPRTFEFPVGVPLTDEEAAELEQRLREELAKPHEPRQFKYPVVSLPTVTALVTEAVVQIPDPDEPGKFFAVHFAAFCDRVRAWSADLPDRISAALQDSVNPTEGAE